MSRAVPGIWGAALALWLCRFYLGYAPGEMHATHETYTYVERVVAFLDLLRAGWVFPHWVVDFRDGLGSPYFGYYQPLFFYLASAFAAVAPLPAALGLALATLAFVGYAAVVALVRPRFGTPAGVLAGTTLLASSYVHTNLYERGDLSEFTGMMLLPVALLWLVRWLDGGAGRHWIALAVTAGAVVCAHPVAGLTGYGALGVVIACWTLLGADRRRAAGAVGALGAGAALVAFYLAPIALEWDLVQASRLRETFDRARHFLGLGELVGLRPSPRRWVTPELGGLVPALAAVAAATAALEWPRLGADRRRLVAALLAAGAGAIWLVHPTAAWVWETVPLLSFAQFPWRLLLVATVVLAVLAGCLARGARPVALAGIACNAAVLYAAEPPLPVMRFAHPETARQLGDRYVAPDAANEWLPRRAVRMLPRGVPRAPRCNAGCVVQGYERTTGRLRVWLARRSRQAEVILPHYAFPVGWTATSGGRPVPIRVTRHGLMRIRAVGDEVDVRFGTTPARRVGAVVSAATAVLLALGALVRRRGRRRAAAPLAAALLALATSGCGTASYLLRSGLEEARILWRREPIAPMLARPDLDASLRERLRLVLDVRAFAESPLGLRVGESFSTFADVDGAAVVWVVSAARRDRLEAYTWWYPIVGRVPYQGFFERDAAERAGRALEAQGLDVDVRPAAAFSTLGWFADPLLSSTARFGPVSLAETVIHELFHATLYVPGAAVFNESAATFVGHRGAMAFFCGGPGADTVRCAEATRQWREVRAHGRVLERFARRLRAMYDAHPGPAARERARARLAAAAGRTLVRRGLGTAAQVSPPNNARLLGMLAYETDLETFERLAPTDAALPDAIGRIVAVARGARQPFEAVRALRPDDALQTHRTGIDSGPSWIPSLSRSTRCSGGSPGGFASSDTTWRTARICTGPAWSPARAGTGAPS